MSNVGNRIFNFLCSAWKVKYQNKQTGQQDAMISAVVGSNKNPITLWVKYEDGSTHQLNNFVIKRNTKKNAEKQPDYYLQYEVPAENTTPVKRKTTAKEAEVVEF